MDTPRRHPPPSRLAPVRPGSLLRLALLLACGCAARSSPLPGAPGTPARVRVVEAEKSPRPAITEVVGTVRATRSATLAPLIGGTVAEIRVGLGSSVRAGDVLVRLAARDVDARLEQSRAVADQAERDRARATFLKEQGVMSVAQFEAAVSQSSVARARRAEALSIADRTVVRAPFSGVITAKIASVGDTALPGQPLLVIETPSALRFEAQVPERAGRDLAVGQRLSVRLEGLEREVDGRIAEIQPASDEVTRTRLFKIDLPDTPGLRPGRFGRLLLGGASTIAVTVPTEAVVRHGQLETVFVVESGLARLRLVRSGREAAGRVEISSGLSGGESVVLAQPAELVDGQRVEATR